MLLIVNQYLPWLLKKKKKPDQPPFPFALSVFPAKEFGLISTISEFFMQIIQASKT